MKNHGRKNHLLAIAAGLSLLAIQSGPWASGTTSLSQTGTSNQSVTEAYAPCATPECEKAKSQLMEALLKAKMEQENQAKRDQALKDEAARVAKENAAKETAAKAAEKPKCEDEESALKELECLAKNLERSDANKDDREAFTYFVLGDTDVETCFADDEISGSYTSRLRTALGQDEDGKVLKALQRGLRKIKDNKKNLSCHAMNIVKDQKTEEFRSQFTPLLRRLQAARKAGDANLVWQLEKRIQNMASLYARNPNSRGIYTKGFVPEYSSLFSTTVRDLLGRDEYGYDLDGRGAFGDVYGWIDGIYSGNYNSVMNSILGGANGTSVEQEFAEYLRLKQYSQTGLNVRSNLPYNFFVGTTPPQMGSSVRFNGQGTLDGMNVMRNLNGQSPFSVRGNGGGRPNLGFDI